MKEVAAARPAPPRHPLTDQARARTGTRGFRRITKDLDGLCEVPGKSQGQTIIVGKRQAVRCKGKAASIGRLGRRVIAHQVLRHPKSVERPMIPGCRNLCAAKRIGGFFRLVEGDQGPAEADQRTGVAGYQIAQLRKSLGRVTGHADRSPATSDPMAVRNDRLEIVLLRTGQ